MKVKVRGAKAAARGLRQFFNRHEKAATAAYLEIIKTTLQQAAMFTPRYSGEATGMWRLSTTPVRLEVTNAEWGKAKYPLGIGDAGSGKLVDTVVREQMQSIKEELNKLKGKDKVVYMGNAAPQARLWLNGDTQDFLRVVNEDYITIQELGQYAKSRGRNVIADYKRGTRGFY